APASAEADLDALLAQAAQPEEKPAPATAAQPSLDADLDALLAQAAQPAAQPAPEPAPASAEVDLDALLAQAAQPEEKPAPATAAQPSLDADLDALLAQAAQPAVQPAPESAPASAEVDLEALLAQAAQPEEKPAPAEETTRAVDPLDFESLLAQANANINDTEDKDLTEAEAPAAAVMTETAAENLDADALLAQMPVEVTAQPTPDTEAAADAIPSSPDAKEAEEAEAAPAQPDILPETEGIEATSLDGQPDAFAAHDATDAEQVLPEALLETIPASAGLSPAESDGQSPAEAGPSVMESIADSLTDAAVPPQEPRPDSEAFPLAPEALTAGAAPESPIGENGTEEPASAEVAAASSMPQPAAGGLDDLFTEGSEHNRRLMELVSAAVAEGVAAAQPASELPGNDDGVLAARLDALEERFTTFTARLDETVAASVEKAVQGIQATIESSLNDRLQALADAQGEARAEAEAGINERLQAAADAQAAAREEESQALDARLQELSARLDALAAQSDAMKPLEEKINALQERLEAAESDRKSAGAVAAVEERLAEQKREGEAAAARMDALENRLDALTPTFNERVEKAAAAAAARILREEIANLLKE
ncbi:MAG: hypothetical protein J5838_03085, partial [Desulfovibrio sp.]|nr:hypothetical protein [Desulfovibrio sp.]